MTDADIPDKFEGCHGAQLKELWTDKKVIQGLNPDWGNMDPI